MHDYIFKRCHWDIWHRGSMAPSRRFGFGFRRCFGKTAGKKLFPSFYLRLRESKRKHGCQMAIARFLDRMCLALWASGIWLQYATLQNLIPSFPWLAPPHPPPWPVQGKEGIKFFHLATLREKGRKGESGNDINHRIAPNI